MAARRRVASGHSNVSCELYKGIGGKRRINGHAVPTRASEYDQPSFQRPRLLPCPEDPKTSACSQATNSLACIWQRRTSEWIAPDESHPRTSHTGEGGCQEILRTGKFVIPAKARTQEQA